MTDLHSLARSLKNHPVVSDLDPAHLEFLAGCTKNVRLADGEYLFREGSPANDLYLIREGKIALEVHAPPRGSIVLETLHRGDAIGWSALFPPYAWYSDGRATRGSLLFSVDAKCLRAKLDGDHDFGYAFMRTMLGQVHRRLDRARLQQLDVYRSE